MERERASVEKVGKKRRRGLPVRQKKGMEQLEKGKNSV